MLALLLARAGVDVLVLEKHADFLRDFRGDTIHPSTLVVLGELGLLDDFLQLPHSKVHQFSLASPGRTVTLADYRELRAIPENLRYIAFVPQWDFLNFITDRAQRLPGFSLRMRAEVLGVVRQSDRVSGVRYRAADGTVHEVAADLTVAADGRGSAVRSSAGMLIKDYGAPMDVLWFRLPRRKDHPSGQGIRVGEATVLGLFDRGEYWQIGYIIPKGARDVVQARGLESLRATTVRLAPFLSECIGELRSWDEIRLLTVRVDRLRQWYRPGLLCIGDAAHAMSPLGGVGINLAVQDAVAAANLLAGPLSSGGVSTGTLARVQLRRWLPTTATQRLQRVLQRAVFAPTQAGRPPRALDLLRRVPVLRQGPGRLVTMGVLPEHVRTPAVNPLHSAGYT